MPTHEFLDEMWRIAKKRLPVWVYNSLMEEARPKSGGRASHRIDEPNWFEKMALTEITPAHLKEVSDDELGLVWLRLNQWFANARRRKQAVENVVNAALWTMRELASRGTKVEPCDLVREVEALEAVAKERSLSVKGKPGAIPDHMKRVMREAPDEVMLVRDFVSIAGSAAVAEKPADIDVVIRAPYDQHRGEYGLSGASLWVALRRFLAPDKSGPQLQLVASPTGSFTDYIPVFDLVARRRAPEVVKVEQRPPAYKDRDRVIKADAGAATPAIKAQSDRAKREDVLTPGEFFYQPKPTRPAQPNEPQTLDSLVKLFERNAVEWLPASVQKKYDGARHQLHKVGSKVTIYSEDGDDNTERLPGLVKELQKLPVENAVLDAEIEAWDGSNHLPREAASGYLAMRTPPDDSGMVANVFDVMFWDRDLHKTPLYERLKYLDKVGPEGTMAAPDLKRRINTAPAVVANSVDDVRELAERIRKLPGSEGVVVKRLSSAYPLDLATPDTWVKFHNSTLLRGVVIDRVRTKAGAYNYVYGINPGNVKATVLTQDGLMPVGTSFSTAEIYHPGDRLLIETEQLNHELHPGGVVITAWVPRVLGEYDGAPDTADAVVRRAADDLVLRTKVFDPNDQLAEYLPANIIKAYRPAVATAGPVDAPVAFVGASLSRLDLARREPIVGPPGKTLNDLYLHPLGLSRSQVVLMNAVPLLLTDRSGAVREPNDAEVADWRGWLDGELDRMRPGVVVALGRTAQAALGDRATIMLPHPSAVTLLGDTGEVGRKVKRIAQQVAGAKVQKQGPEDEGDTRGTLAVENWNKNWQDMLPASGHGRFAYQHHWRGLQEEQTGLDEQALMRTDHSVHGDLRLEGNGALWGFSMFLGKTSDNRTANLDRIIDWKAGDNIEATPKLSQPSQWLDVGSGKPHITPPGGIGSTTNLFSKFFLRDHGTYRLGVARLHAVEIFLDGQHLKGRYLFTFAPVGGARRWLIDRPEDQTPIAEQRDVADVLGELKRKGQKWLIWSQPETRPVLYDVRTGRAVERKSESPVRIAKADPIKRIVYGIVLDPYGNDGEPTTDAHNDWVPPATVEATAHQYLKGARVVGLQHAKRANAAVVESWLDPYPSREDYVSAMQGADHAIYRRPFGSDYLHSGSWVLGVELGPQEWADYQAGVFNAFSPGGKGMKEPLVSSSMPRVKVINLVQEGGAA